MPKMKTNKAAKKRLRVTATGKIKKGSAYRRHRLLRRTTKTKRDLRTGNILATCEVAKVKLMLGVK